MANVYTDEIKTERALTGSWKKIINMFIHATTSINKFIPEIFAANESNL
jgi:ribosome biogenesis protein Tsr3